MASTIPLLDALSSPDVNLAVQRALGAGVTPLVRTWSALADVWGLMIVMGVLLARRGLLAAYAVLFAVLVAASINVPLVFLFDVPRPAAPGLRVLEELDIPSFPSGHIATAAAIWVTLGRRGWLPAWACAVAIALAAFSRVYLGVHTVADVLAGAAVGAVAALALAAAWPHAEPLWGRPWAVPVRRWAPLAFLAIGLVVTQLGASPKVWESAGAAAAAGAGLALHAWRSADPPAAPPPTWRALLVVLVGVAPLWALATLGPRWSAPVQAALTGVAGLWALIVAPVWLRRGSEERAARPPVV